MLTLLPALFAQNDGDAAAAAGAFAALVGMGCYFLFLAIFIIAVIAGMWKTFEKAGKPGWAAIIPFYNMFVVTEIAGKEILWFILLLVPCVNIVAAIIIAIDMAKAFGKGAGFGLGLAFLPFIFYPILGFGSARYLGPQKSSM